MSSNYWEGKWIRNEIAFHRREFHPKLVQYFPQSLEGKVLVPLCGKSLDMVWLKSAGYKVVGVELSPIACEAFFEENQIPFVVEPRFDGFQVFAGQGIEIWCGDFFQLPKEIWNGVNWIYDRAALVALPNDLRQKYAQRISSIAEERFKEGQDFAVFLISLHSVQADMGGPPFSVDSIEVNQLFGSAFKVTRLVEEKDDEYFKDHPRLKDFQIIESTYLLQNPAMK